VIRKVGPESNFLGVDCGPDFTPGTKTHKISLTALTYDGSDALSAALNAVDILG